MRKFLVAGCFCLLIVSCSPAVPLTTPIPTAFSTLAPAVIVENPPACTEAELELRGEL